MNLFELPQILLAAFRKAVRHADDQVTGALDGTYNDVVGERRQFGKLAFSEKGQPADIEHFPEP
jgi:hypothetical protein